MKKIKFKLLTVFTLSFILLVAVVIISNSFVRNITVTGNYFIKDEYILNLLDIDYDSSFILLMPKNKKIKNDIFIKDISLTKGKNKSITINVEENSIIGYMIFVDDNTSTNYVLLKDGTVTVLEPSIIKSLSNIVFIEGFEKNELDNLAKNLSVINPEIMLRISEIKKNPLSYEDGMLKFVMEDGLIIYCENDKASYLNNYFEIMSNYSSKYGCLLFDSFTSTAISISCDSIENVNDEERNQ